MNSAKNVFKNYGKVLVCKVSNKDVVVERKSQVQEHIRTETHQHRLKYFSSSEKQMFLSECDTVFVTSF